MHLKHSTKLIDDPDVSSVQDENLSPFLQKQNPKKIKPINKAEMQP